jgi:hypothetical protein
MRVLQACVSKPVPFLLQLAETVIWSEWPRIRDDYSFYEREIEWVIHSRILAGIPNRVRPDDCEKVLAGLKCGVNV